MSGGEKPKFKRRRLIGAVCSLASLTVLTYIAIALISGRGLSLSWVKGIFSKNAPVEFADEYNFDVGRERVFAILNNSIASAGTLGIQVLDAGGSNTLRDPFRMSIPAIDAQEGRAIAFDIGGTAARVFSDTDFIASIETSSAIISASINRNGWFCVCAQESAGYKGAVTVYNSKGVEAYKVRLASGYILTAALSPDNKTLAILNFTDGGSCITFYNLNSEDAANTYFLPDGLIIDIMYLSGGDLLAVSKDSLITIDKNGADRELYGFSGGILSGYALTGGFIAVHLLDYGVGYNGRLVTLGVNGDIIGELAINREIISMSTGGELLAILRSDGLIFYDSHLDEIPQHGEPGAAIGATKVLVLTGDAALAAGDHSAVVIRVIRADER